MFTEFTGIRELPNVSTQKWLKTCSSPQLPQSFVSSAKLFHAEVRDKDFYDALWMSELRVEEHFSHPSPARLLQTELRTARKLNIDFVVKQEKFFNLFRLVWCLVLSGLIEN